MRNNQNEYKWELRAWEAGREARHRVPTHTLGGLFGDVDTVNQMSRVREGCREEGREVGMSWGRASVQLGRGRQLQRWTVERLQDTWPRGGAFNVVWTLPPTVMDSQQNQQHRDPQGTPKEERQKQASRTRKTPD